MLLDAFIFPFYLTEVRIRSDFRLWISYSSVPEEEPTNLGGRFSKSPSERERILHRRKEQLLQVARRRYLDKQAGTKVSSESLEGTEGTTSPDIFSESI